MNMKSIIKLELIELSNITTLLIYFKPLFSLRLLFQEQTKVLRRLTIVTAHEQRIFSFDPIVLPVQKKKRPSQHFSKIQLDAISSIYIYIYCSIQKYQNVIFCMTNTI